MRIEELNDLSSVDFKNEIIKCCGSSVWVEKILDQRPFKSLDSILQVSESIWNSLTEKDWIEAFTHHPKIGDINSLREKFSSTKDWATGEQSGVDSASEEILKRLAEKNKEYEEKFGYIFIVCATGKSVDEMLEALNRRLKNKHEDEIKIAAGEQAKITKLRLEKLLA